MNEKLLQFILRHPYEVNTTGASDERQIRDIISKLRKENVIYIPIASKT